MESFDIQINSSVRKDEEEQDTGITDMPQNYVTPGTCITRESGFMR